MLLRSIVKIFSTVFIAVLLIFSGCSNSGEENIEDNTDVEATIDVPDLELSDSGFNFIKLKWQDVGVDTYDIYRFSWQTGKYEKIASSSKTEYMDEEVESGKIYWYELGIGEQKSKPFEAFTSCWQIERVDTVNSTGYYSDILYQEDKIYIAYFDASQRDLKIAIREGDEWSIETIDSEGAVGYWPHLTFFNNQIYVSYYDNTNQTIKVATKSGGTWSITTVDSGYYYNDITSSDTIHVFYNKNNHLWHAWLDNNIWNTEVIFDANNINSYISAGAFDKKLYIAYYNDDSNDLMLATYSDSSWNIETVQALGDSGRYCSLYVYQDAVYIAYYANSDLAISTNENGYWEQDIVDTGGYSGYDTSIYVDNKAVRIAFYNSTYQKMYFATNKRGFWETFLVDRDDDYLARYPSLTIKNNLAIISYYKNSDLHIAEEIR